MYDKCCAVDNIPEKKLSLASSEQLHVSSVNITLLTHPLPGLVSMVMSVYSMMCWHLRDVNATFDMEREY